MTFEDAVDIMYDVKLPKKEEHFTIDTEEGKKMVKAIIRKNLALYRYNRQWHLIHTLTGLSIHTCSTFHEAEELMKEILGLKIDTVFTRRDINVAKSISQLLSLVRDFRQRQAQAG